MKSDQNPFDLSVKKSATYYSQVRPEMMKFIPQASRKILDVGCGEGLFGRQLKDTLDAEVWGIELNGKSAIKAQSNIDRIIHDDIGHAMGSIPDKYFDCVVLMMSSSILLIRTAYY